MKTSILTMFLLFSSIVLYSQRVSTPPSVTRFNGQQYSFYTTKQRLSDSVWVQDSNITRTININFNDTTKFTSESNQFLFGYHWSFGSNAIIERRLHTNMPMGNFGFGKGIGFDNYELTHHVGILDSQTYNRDINLIWKFEPMIDAGVGLTNTIIEWRPATPIFNEDSTLNTIPGDKYGSIFGFRQKQHGVLITDSTDYGFMGMLLHPDSLPGGVTSLPILSKPDLYNEIRRSSDEVPLKQLPLWRNMTDTAGKSQQEIDSIILEYSQYKENRKNDSTYWEYLRYNSGNHWYIMVNVRRQGDPFNGNYIDTNKVLTMKLRYWYKRKVGTSTYIVDSNFVLLDSVFTFRNSNDTIRTARGTRFKVLTPIVGLDSSVFIVRRNMLPRSIVADTLKDICLGAFFRTTNNPDPDSSNKYYAPNIWFPSGSNQISPIDSIDVQVDYNGGCGIAITHLALTTPFGVDLLFGNRDTAIAASVDRAIKCLDILQQYNPQQHIRLYRLYANDESPPRFWRANRYLNSLLEGFHISAVSGDRYQHHVPQRTFWEEESYIPSSMQMNTIGTSFYRTDTMTKHTYWLLNFRGGYTKLSKQNLSEISPRNYDCQRCEAFGVQQEGYPLTRSVLPISTLSSNGFTVLCQMESLARHVFLNRRKYYSDAPIISRHSITTWFDYGAVRLANNAIDLFWRYYESGGHPRATTGEELRCAIGQSLIMASKGVNYADGLANRESTLDTSWVLNKMRADTGHHGPKYMDSTNTFWNYSLLYNLSNLYSFKVQGDVTGTTTLLSDTVGHDFFVPTPNSNSWKFVRTQELADSMGVPLNRIFTGMRSKRKILMEEHDKIISVESEIMKLELCSWQGKGFNWFRTSRNDDTTWYARFVDFGWDKVKVRELSKSQPEAWGTRSTFFDMTILRRKDISQDSIFYVGVLNRHVNPNVEVNPDTTLLDTARYKFYPTFEFDSLVTAGQLSKYSQLGSREITIPFHYDHPDTRKRLLHITELGGSLDTVIGQHTSLALLYKPGESRILKVQILPAVSSVAYGHLHNSNQRKLIVQNKVVFEPLTGAYHETDTLLYHLVYHRIDSIDGRMKVYYRRSAPTLQGKYPVSAMQWENELCLSQSPIQKQNGDTITMQAGFPSIVVRPDSVNKKMNVYVVFAGEVTPRDLQYSIIEHVLDAQTTIQTVGTSRQIDSALGIRYLNFGVPRTTEQFLADCGAPNINASATGNYYTWADSLRGITVRWKGPNSSYFTTTAIDSIKRFSNSVQFAHPSFNTYSRMKLGERDAALVWEERGAPQAPANNIYYTRVRFTGNSLIHFLPKNLDSVLKCPVSPDSTIAKLSDSTNGDDHEFPTVYRGVEEYATDTTFPYNNRRLITAHWDRTAWVGRYTYQAQYTIVNTRAIDLRDSGAFVPYDYWWVHRPASIYSSGLWSFGFPTLSQGGVNSNGFTNYSDSAFVLNIESAYNSAPIPYIYNYHVWQFQSGYWGYMLNDIDANLWSSNANEQYLGMIYGGLHPQLAARNSLPISNMWNVNRKVYHSEDDSTLTNIVSSAEFFAKRAVDVNPNHQVLHYKGFSARNRKMVLSQLQLGNNQLAFNATMNHVSDYTAKYNDTLFTRWFSIGNIQESSQFVRGITQPCVKILLQEQGSDKIWNLPVSASGDRTKKNNRFIFQRGGNKHYRCMIINTCTNELQPQEEIEISIDTSNTLSKQTTNEMERTVIDLGKNFEFEHTLSVYPNPADEELFIKFNGLVEDIQTADWEYRYDVIDNIGNLYQQGWIRAGRTLRINTSEYTNGTYRVLVRGSIGGVSTSFVIFR